MAQNIVIVDYGMSNLHSVLNALRTLGGNACRVTVTSDVREIDNADKVVFPGQGAARDCMKKLDETGLSPAIAKAAREKPFLGICMGMQVLFDHSDENDGTKCLGLYKGTIRHLSELGATGPGHKIPHLGWNRVRHNASSGDHPMWHNISDDDYFFFVHSYYVAPADETLIAGVSHHGGDFASAIACGHVFAVQFHPEKSAHAGRRLLKNFIGWAG